MTELAAPESAPVEAPSRRKRLSRVFAWLIGLALAAIICQLAGIDLKGWIASLWDALTAVSAGWIVVGLMLQSVQTAFTAYAWWAILEAAYPKAGVRFLPVLTCYATAVALNGVLPANIGTFTMFFMYLAVVAGATFAGIFSGYLVHKIFFTIAGGAVYLYLFLAIPGSFDVQLGGLHEHWLLAVIITAGVIFLLVVVARILWRWIKKLWQQAKQGGAILATPRKYFLKVFFPEAIAYAAKMGVIAVFLAAYSIPVTFGSVMAVVGGNSIANVTSVTPGGVGVNQAINAVALSSYTDKATATAYSLGQQLVTTAWNIVVAVALVALVFGWHGGKTLVSTSYGGAKSKAAEMAAKRKSDRAAKREARRKHLKDELEGEDEA
ncbi:MAG TPA: lysylphosphatidylglycerol synthase transmembrane domain-containing protein [Gaiellaceae bacterium]